MILIFDFLISIILLLSLIPLIIFIGLLILIVDGKPVFFVSQRIGKDFKSFNILKFRTMKNNLKKDEITFLGKFLRRTSLDELPQLLNVLKGEMSIVGPRPLPKNVFNKISEKKKIIRSSIKPGITGYSQINYAGKKRSLNAKIKLDLIYIQNKSFNMYICIIFLTPLILIKRYFFNKDGKTL